MEIPPYESERQAVEAVPVAQCAEVPRPLCKGACAKCGRNHLSFTDMLKNPRFKKEVEDLKRAAEVRRMAADRAIREAESDRKEAHSEYERLSRLLDVMQGTDD